ncbi:hypothetical protein ACFFJY_10095 [Fictibacillus aquaticus]|uniref:Uncharacterized protein n=1 Tax=Fictibacillus aquaticus TaxID=2021314 RepID=A0A235FCF2_9BACL|nr:hypothetical protein [Fictibacillus aquaticus]OYD58613.1 hypothetical protein CGZ90_01550 [Fictibacillus aquaticus]
MDRLLNDMKQEFENSISADPVFSLRERCQIIKLIEMEETRTPRPSSWFPKLLSGTVLASLFLFTLFIMMDYTGVKENTQSSHNKKQTNIEAPPHHISENEINEKVAYIESKMKLGLSETEVHRLFGKNFVILDNSDSENGSVKRIGYNLLVNDPSLEKKMDSSIIDEENLLKRNIGVQLFIGFTKEGKVQWATSNYAYDGEVYMTSWDKNGMATKKLHEAAEKKDEIIEDYASEQYKTFSDKEKEVYEAFRKSLDENLLRDLDPISIAKFYAQANIAQEFDVVYALYTDRKNYIHMSKEEYEKLPSSHRFTPENAFNAFKNIEKGKFISHEDNITAHIEYMADPDAEAPSGFTMVKDEDGIWNISFLPLQ